MNDSIAIASKEQLEQAALRYAMLPFFANPISGFSVEEMAAPGMLFGETSADYGCWEWKGPVIREQTTAYGKFFNRKAGFVSLALLPDFLNYRRAAYPVAPGSTEEMLLDLIRAHEGITSTELKRIVFGAPQQRKKNSSPLAAALETRARRKSLEGPLQRLQMGGWILIADFEYKHTPRGERYGWGVALYSTPEIWFEREFSTQGRTPAQSFSRLVSELSSRLPDASPGQIAALIK